MGRNDNWSQLGNDAIVANAYNHGYTQLWSQARVAQWANRYDAGARQFGGGFGYLRLADGEIANTLYGDRARDSRYRRWFGTGYARKSLVHGPVWIEESTTTPWGDDPALVHEVKLTNTSEEEQPATWWEYWGVNPYDETTNLQRGVEAPSFDPQTSTLSACAAAERARSGPADDLPHRGRCTVDGFEADANAFFGDGDRAQPAAVGDDAGGGSLAPPTPEEVPGRGMFALRSPVTLEPGESVRLRYVYGIAHEADVAGVVQRASAGRSTMARTARKWAAWVPSADLGGKRRWLARELAWDAYMVRSSTVYEEVCGHHVITQGGYYQYGGGQQIAFRDPLQHALPMVYAEPELVREVLRYSFQQQTVDTGRDPLRDGADVHPARHRHLERLRLLGASDPRRVRDGDAGHRLPRRGAAVPRRPAGPAADSGSIWEHVKLAIRHQETLPGRGPAGHYIMGATGDWSDFSTAAFGGASESVLVTAQLAYVYPLLAEVADLRGDTEFAAELRALGERNLGLLRDEWIGARLVLARLPRTGPDRGRRRSISSRSRGRCWPARPDPEQAGTLVANIERFLQGVGAPPRARRPDPDRDLAVALRGRPAGHRDRLRRRRRRQQRGLRRRHLVRAQRPAHLGARGARRRRPGRRAQGARRARAQHAAPPTPARSRTTGRASSTSTTPAAPSTRRSPRSAGSRCSTTSIRPPVRSPTSRRGASSRRCAWPASSRPGTATRSRRSCRSAATSCACPAPGSRSRPARCAATSAPRARRTSSSSCVPAGPRRAAVCGSSSTAGESAAQARGRCGHGDGPDRRRRAARLLADDPVEANRTARRPRRPTRPATGR